MFHHLRRFIAGIIFILVAANCAHATSVLPFYEPFPASYTNGSLLGAGTSTAVWDVGNTGTSGAGVVTNLAALNYPGLTNSSGLGLRLNATPSAARNKGATFTSQTFSAANPTLYVSLLLNIETNAAADRLFAALSSTTTGTTASSVMGVWVNSLNQLTISKNSSAANLGTFTSALASGTHLVVLRYKFNAGSGDDEVSLWVDPSSLGAAEASVPTPVLTTTTGTDTAALSSVWVFHPATAGVVATLQLDEIRVDTTWAGVTPTGVLVPPTNSAPVITNVAVAPTNVELLGTNGVANAFYRVLSATNPASPTNLWLALQTNTFDVAGNFDCTVAATNLVNFFRLLAPGGGTPPTISTPPAAQTIIAGQNLTLNVSASGSPTLGYQWQFANAPLAGATASSLLVTNAQSDDAGTYSVIVSNAFGIAYSAGAPVNVIVPPSINTQPLDQTLSIGQDATFTVEAVGTPLLRYQWFFNTNTPLANATNSSLSILNLAATNAGKYSVVITNAGGAVTSLLATLTVNAGPTPPSLTTAPSAQAANLGQSATFTVAASGSLPLVYQWLFNTNTTLAAATNTSLTLTNAQLTNAGFYSVRVTNAYGSITSTPVALTVSSNVMPDFSMIGFATLNGFTSNKTILAGGTTGGSNGPIVLVSNVTQLVNYATKSNQALRILILTNIDMGPLNNNDNPTNILQTGKIQIKGHKTLYSTNGATISRGSFHVIGTSNVIIRNLKFRDLYFDNSGADPGFDNHDWDYVRVDTGHHVWVDHCDFMQSYDGMVDIKDGADYVTVSWCKFQLQKKGSLVGSSDSSTTDTGHLNVTFHHNWYEDVNERAPRMRFGNAHVFNMYYANAHAAGKTVQSTASAAVLLENSFFTNAPNVYGSVYVNGGLVGNAMKVVNSSIVNSSGNKGFAQTNQASFTFNAPWVTNAPPYGYTNVLDPLASVPYIVTNWAGVGKITSF